MTSTGATDDGVRPDGPDLGAVLAAIESMTPEAIAALSPPSPDPATYLKDHPNLTAVTTRDVVVAGPHGDLPARIYRHPQQRRDVAIVWVHGGGFVGGDLDMPEAHWVALSLAAAGYGVLSVDYHRCMGAVHFPVPSDDVLAAWQWAEAHADELAASPGRIHLGGASAGASLAAGVAKRLRDAGEPAPTSLILAYPTLHPDPIALGSADTPVSLERAQAGAILQWMSRNYAGSEAMLSNSYAFPALGELSALPPTWILTCELDLLRPSGEVYADGLRAAGVPVNVEVEPGAGHGHLNDPSLISAKRTIDKLSDWLARN